MHYINCIIHLLKVSVRCNVKKREWIVKTENKDYEIKLVSNSKITIDGKEYAIKKLKSKTMLGFITEYELPIEDKKIILSYYISKYIIVVDDKNYDNGDDYVAISEIPAMTYVFMVLNSINIINGAVGGCCVVLGIFLTLKISCSNMNIFIKLLLNIFTLIGMFAIVFAIAILLNTLLSY